jgi:adenine-specific DNA-methyltransferase
LDNIRSQSIGRKKGHGAASWFEVEVVGRKFTPGPDHRWKTNETGMERLLAAGRVMAGEDTLNYVRFLDDFGAIALNNLWSDTVTSGFSNDGNRYVVRTSPKVIARCVLMTSDPGDLVLDPTCGGGTTPVVCEDFGRRWIAIDTSRVALTVTRERLLTSKFDYYKLVNEGRGVDGGLVYETQKRVTLGSIAKGEEAEEVAFYDRPEIEQGKVRVSGPFTVEALSRYAVNPLAPEPRSANDDASDHVAVLLEALRKQGIPRPGTKPLKVEALTEFAASGRLQAEGVLASEQGARRFAVSLGPRFGSITMAQVSDALREAVGFDLVVFAGFAVDAETQSRLSKGRVGGIDVALLLANPDLLLGDLLKNTTASQTFRLYAAPDVSIQAVDGDFQVAVNGVDSYDALTGEVKSEGRSGLAAWFLDDDYDGTVFRASQAFFPVNRAWERLEKALQGSVDAGALARLHAWESLPFERGQHGRVAVRVISADGNAAEAVMELPA